jgi:acetyltransferase-like isoleucine patch superfamily enzyme
VKKMKTVLLPILDANMTHGVVRAWLKREGDAVRAGEPLFEVETDKINAEVEAEVSGVLRRIVAPQGTRVPVLGLLAFVGSADEAVPAPETWETGAVPSAEQPNPLPPFPAREGGSEQTSPLGVGEGPGERFPAGEPTGRQDSRGTATAASRPTASPAARRLARERGLALDIIRGTGARGEITRADVEAADVRAATTGGAGQLDPAFLNLLRRDPVAFRALSSETKLQLYRQHGARIGDRVHIQPGAIIVAEEIVIGAGSVVGADSVIECEQLRLGRLVAFGKRTRVHCRSVEIGDALWSKDDVVIGGGGSEEAGARLRAGDACFFGEAAYLNTCHPLTLGDEVCIGSRAMLFTHSHWQSVLRGYPSLFGPIEIGSHVFVGNTAFVFPGVSLGAGATVMVNSFVATNVPANTLVGGVPAHVIRHIVAPTRDEQTDIVRQRLLPELAQVLTERGYQVRQETAGDVTTLDLGDGRIVHFAASWTADSMPQRPRAVVLTFDAAPAGLPAGGTLFDLASARVSGMQDQLSDEVREFCRRRGIRFHPFAWRYGVGHFEGERFHSRHKE